MRNRRGLPIGRVAVVRDLREVCELRHRLIIAARLAAVGELAAGIAHEINNPIAYVRSNLAQLQDHWKNLSAEIEGDELNAKLAETFNEAEELLFESLEGVDRAAEIVRGVMGFAHAGPSSREPSDLNRLLDDVLRIEELENGFALWFPVESGQLQRLAEFVELESQCCAFLDFEIRLKGGAEEVALNLTGPEGTKEVLGGLLKD